MPLWPSFHLMSPSAFLALLLGPLFFLGACALDEEADKGRDDELLVPQSETDFVPFQWPAAGPSLEGNGLILPRSPGLRLQDAGYLSRLRLDSLDLILPYSWLSIERTENKAFLRFRAATQESSKIFPHPSSFQANIVLERQNIDRLKVPFRLEKEELFESQASLVTPSGDSWTVELESFQLSFEDKQLFAGSIEGLARRGAKGIHQRRLLLHFIAYKALP